MADKYLNSLLGENETILLVARQHWLILLGEILVEALLTIAIIVLVSVILGMTTLPFAAFGYLLLILPLVSMWRDYLIWSRRQYIVTSRRVIQLSGVFSKSITDSSLEKVNDVKMTQSFLGRLLDYGDIEILTASELGVNLFRRIGSPIRFKTAMLNAKERLEAEQASGGRWPRGEVPSLIAKLDELRQHGVLTEDEFNRKKTELLARI